LIQKIISINNVGRFTSCKPRGDVSFGKCSLVFGENGRGKTTLCAILRSLQSGDPLIIRGRKTLGLEEIDPYIEFRLDTGNTVFRNGTWSQVVPDLAVFDNSFVTQNVFSGESVEVEHRKNLYTVIVGKQVPELGIS